MPKRIIPSAISEFGEASFVLMKIGDKVSGKYLGNGEPIATKYGEAETFAFEVEKGLTVRAFSSWALSRALSTIPEGTRLEITRIEGPRKKNGMMMADYAITIFDDPSENPGEA